MRITRKRCKANFVFCFLLLPALLQLLPLFLQKDLYPFSQNEMYAGTPPSTEVRMFYIYALIEDSSGHVMKSGFLYEVNRLKIDRALESESPNWNEICDWIRQDIEDGVSIIGARVIEKYWKKIDSSNVLKPDFEGTLHECTFD